MCTGILNLQLFENMVSLNLVCSLSRGVFSDVQVCLWLAGAALQRRGAVGWYHLSCLMLLYISISVLCNISALWLALCLTSRMWTPSIWHKTQESSTCRTSAILRTGECFIVEQEHTNGRNNESACLKTIIGIRHQRLNHMSGISSDSHVIAILIFCFLLVCSFLGIWWLL